MARAGVRDKNLDVSREHAETAGIHSTFLRTTLEVLIPSTSIAGREGGGSCSCCCCCCFVLCSPCIHSPPMDMNDLEWAG